jgi:hypothetical protein
MKTYELGLKEGGWVLWQQGARRAVRTFGGATKKEAVRKSAQFLQEQNAPRSLKIRKKNGAYQEERTFPPSADPRRRRG